MRRNDMLAPTAVVDEQAVREMEAQKNVFEAFTKREQARVKAFEERYGVAYCETSDEERRRDAPVRRVELPDADDAEAIAKLFAEAVAAPGVSYTTEAALSELMTSPTPLPTGAAETALRDRATDRELAIQRAMIEKIPD
jgi:hypothetical protein